MRALRLRYLCAATVILAIAAVIAWRVASSAPSWYRPPTASDPHITQLADDIEYRIVEEVHRPRAEPFTMRLREEHANAWLAARLPRWVAGRGLTWPSVLGTPQVRFTERGIDLAGEVHTAQGTRFLVAHLQPRIDGEQLIITITGVSIGRVPLHGASVEALLDMLPPNKKSELIESELGAMLIDAMRGGATFEPAIRLADDRNARAIGIATGQGTVDLTLRIDD